MSTPVDTTLTWTQWEGQTIDGRFKLLKLLGASLRGGVFLTERNDNGPQTAVIKLVLADRATAKEQIARWKASAILSHPRLLRMFEMGDVEAGGVHIAYLLMEYAEEDLSQVHRSLTPLETTEVLRATTDALSYLHGKGLVHGHLRPSNILAVNNRLKISSDTIRPAGSWHADLDKSNAYHSPGIGRLGATAASDMWSLGVVLVETVTNQLPSWQTGAAAATVPPTLPDQLREPVLGMLRVNPAHRWSASELRNYLESGAGSPVPTPPPEGTTRTPPVRRLVLTAMAVAVVLACIFLGLTLMGRRVAPLTPTFDTDRNPEPPTSPKSSGTAPASASEPGEVASIEQVLPNVPLEASRTIRGNMVIRVRVGLDNSGRVRTARLETSSPSRYFGNLALEAAKQWKFSPSDPRRPGAQRDLTLLFQFVNDDRHPASARVLQPE